VYGRGMADPSALSVTEQPGERADSRRNRLRLIAAAKAAVAESGVNVSALDIANEAGVGVGTLYRRFGTKEALIECIMLALVEELRAQAVEALADPDPWDGLAGFLIELSQAQQDCRGLAELAAMPPERKFELFGEQTRALLSTIEQLTDRAHAAGVLRQDVTWRDIVLLSRAPLETNQAMGLRGDDHQWRRTMAVVLDGLRAPGVSPLPGSPPQEVAP
jgi:AcrR family transcriptional regulator